MKLIEPLSRLLTLLKSDWKRAQNEILYEMNLGLGLLLIFYFFVDFCLVMFETWDAKGQSMFCFLGLNNIIFLLSCYKSCRNLGYEYPEPLRIVLALNLSAMLAFLVKLALTK